MDLLKELCSSEKLWGEFLLGIQAAMLVSDLDGQILFASPAVRKMLSYEPDALQGKAFSTLFTPEDLTFLYPNLLCMACKGREYEGEAMLIRADGTRIIASIAIRPSLEPDRDRNFIVISLQDISTRKNLEKALDLTHYEQLVQLANGIAHELRNPLVGIGGFIQRVFKECQGIPDYDRYHAYIMSNLGKIENLVRKVEFFAHLPKPSPRETHIRDVIENGLQPFLEKIREKKVSLDLRVEEVAFRMDKELMGRAVSILVENAMDALCCPGTIGLHCESREDQCILRVSDTGIGISSQDLPYIFNPFFSTKSTGTGMDLAIVKRIVESHGGRVEVASAPGDGTTFSLYLPLERRSPLRTSRLEP